MGLGLDQLGLLGTGPWPSVVGTINISIVRCHRQLYNKEGADRVRGRWEMRGREGGGEGAGGGRRGGGRREKRGWEEGEGRKRGREGKFARAKRAPLQKGGGRQGGGRGEVRGREGGETYPPVHPLNKGTSLYSCLCKILYVSLHIPMNFGRL